MAEANLQKLKVLVADDEPKLRALVAGVVRSLGCETFEARDGDEAWAIAQTRRLDVVVLDVMMPGMSGWEVCRRIKASSKTARGAAPKVLMLTGIGEHLNEMTSPLFAADAWIDKPFDLEAMRRKVVELGEASLREVPQARASGPSLKKARPSPERSKEHESAGQPKPKKKKKPKKRPAPAPKKKRPQARAKKAKSKAAKRRPNKPRPKSPAPKKRRKKRRR